MGNYPLIFISYAREDIETAKRLYHNFKHADFCPWMDKPPSPYKAEGLLAGQNWKAAITQKIKEADYVALLLSSVSISRRGYIQREMRFALDRMNELPPDEVYLLPILVDECNPPNITVGTVSLQDLNWVQLWDGGLEVILATVKQSIRIKNVEISTEPDY